VTYDGGAILGLRIVNAPVEDLLFGFALVVQSMSWWVWWGRRLGDVTDGPPAPAPARAGRPAAGGRG
jgi:hypothetical protein